MQIVHSLREILERNSADKSTYRAATIGNFDGMHLGHQALLDVLERELYARTGDKLAEKSVISFSPHPKRVFSGKSRSELNQDNNLLPVMPLRERYEFFRDRNFETCYIIRFSKQFSQTTAKQFIEEYLANGLAINLLVVGHDWTFGHNREGNPASLQEMAAKHNIEVIVVPPFEIKGERVSTTLIKKLLLAGSVADLNLFLGRYYYLTGRVVHGAARGKTLGFPTANLHFEARLLPKDGVYATLVNVGSKLRPGVTNIGYRPTFNLNTRTVETHILAENNMNLYGQRIRVDFIDRIRDEMKFTSASELMLQIQRDCVQAQSICVTALERSAKQGLYGN